LPAVPIVVARFAGNPLQIEEGAPIIRAMATEWRPQPKIPEASPPPAAEPKPTAIPPADEPPLAAARRLPTSPGAELVDDPARFFLEGGLDGPAGPHPPATANVCLFCWEGLADEATECGNCGKSVAAMAAEQAARDLTDRSWAPERLLPEKKPAPKAVRPRRESETLRAVTAWISRTLEKRGRTIGIAVALPAMVFGAAAGGQWLAYATTPRSPLSEMPALNSAGTDGPLSSVRVKNPPEGLRLSLITPRGRVVANFIEGDDNRIVKVRPGRYQLRAADLTGAWKSSSQPVRAPSGKTVVLVLASETLAEYHIWQADQAARKGNNASAANAWRSALQHAPKNAEAHLGLAQALAGQFRFTEARAELRRAAELAPKDPRIGRLQAAIQGSGQ
jgi:hypothetical protein